MTAELVPFVGTAEFSDESKCQVGYESNTPLWTLRN
jgi:hypothetical protein